MRLQRHDRVQLITDPKHTIGRIVHSRNRLAEVKWPGKKGTRTHRKDFLEKVGAKCSKLSNTS